MRISREAMFMDACEVWAKRSTCFRGNIGAMIVKDNDVVSIGYNGPAAGEPHCDGDMCPRSESGGCLVSVHAERNAILRASNKLRVGQLSGHHLYCTYAPCEDCAQFIVTFEIRLIYYRHPYRLKEGLHRLLKQPFTTVKRITPAGMIIDERTGKIVSD